MELQIGELFMLGFRGPQIPGWMHDFAHEFGLGGVILFDYDCIDKKYERNIFNRPQVTQLCEQIHSLPSHPMNFYRSRRREGPPSERAVRFRSATERSPVRSANQFGTDTVSARVLHPNA